MAFAAGALRVPFPLVGLVYVIVKPLRINAVVREMTCAACVGEEFVGAATAVGDSMVSPRAMSAEALMSAETRWVCGVAGGFVLITKTVPGYPQ